jgi:hypothetical protein
MLHNPLDSDSPIPSIRLPDPVPREPFLPARHHRVQARGAEVPDLLIGSGKAVPALHDFSVLLLLAVPECDDPLEIVDAVQPAESAGLEDGGSEPEWAGNEAEGEAAGEVGEVGRGVEVEDAVAVDEYANLFAEEGAGCLEVKEHGG